MNEQQPQQQEYFLVEGDELTDLMAFGCTPDAPVLKAITNRRFNPVPPPGLPDNYWYCPFRVGCEEGESWCSWPCDKWANWHDAARDAQARETFAKELSEQIERTYSKSGVMNVCDLLEYIKLLKESCP